MFYNMPNTRKHEAIHPDALIRESVVYVESFTIHEAKPKNFFPAPGRITD